MFIRPLEFPADPKTDHGQRLLDALPERASGAGVGAVELAGEDLELLEGPGVVGLSPRPAQSGTGRRSGRPLLVHK